MWRYLYVLETGAVNLKGCRRRIVAVIVVKDERCIVVVAVEVACF